MQYTKVEQEEMVVVPAESNLLWTEGVSTCICLMMFGRVSARKFIAMYHWDGFATTMSKNDSDALKGAIFNIFRRFRLIIRKIMCSFDKPQLDFFYHVGGERATCGLSGTELEVQELNKHAVVAAKKYFDFSKHVFFGGRHFLTHGDKSLRVKLSFARFSYADDREFDKQLDESDTDTSCSGLYISGDMRKITNS